jgi:exopolyphosphatase/guanosine-5'-triphosphate,3'-diphosphate pyrophosphatase
LRVVDSFSQIVALGEGLAATGQLSDAAMQRAIDALRKCSDKVKKHRPVQSRFIATQACRAASNGRAFVSEVRRTVGLPMETISPKEEAKFALLGSLDLVDPAYDFALVIDIGGRSTELILGQNALASTLESYRVGSVAWSMKYFPEGIWTSSAFKAAEIAAKAVLDDLAIDDVTLIGIAKGPDRNAGRETYFIEGREPFTLAHNHPVHYFLQRLLYACRLTGNT